MIGNGDGESSLNDYKKHYTGCPAMIYEGRLKSKFPYSFLSVMWTFQREIAGKYNFPLSGNTVKIV